jgi:hypothetical protein
VEHPRLSLVMLVIAAATLATDLTRLVFELFPTPAVHEPVPIQPRPGEQRTPPPAADMPQRDAAQRPDAPERKVEPPGNSARGPPRGSREPGAAERQLFQLPPDFSTKGAPWCLACRQLTRRYVERRRIHDW